MSVSDATQRGLENVRPRRAVSKPGKWWGDTQKIEAVKTYIILGNLALTAATLKIPEQTLRNWRRADWWKEIENDLKLQDELQLSQRVKQIVAKSMDVVEDRLEHGDYVYDQKSGAMRRKPVSARDADSITKNNLDRLDKLSNRTTSEATEEATADKLLKLAQKFAELAGAARKEEPIELEMVQNDGDAGEVWAVPDDESSEYLGEEGGSSPS